MTLSTQQIPQFRIKTHTAGFQLSDPLLDILETEINKDTTTVRLMAESISDDTSTGGNKPEPEPELLTRTTEDKHAGGLVHESSISTLNFRDPNYGPESGGFHPVEIAIARKGELIYVTDFAYVGSGYFAELDRELDFDFAGQQFVHGSRAYKLQTGRAMFDLWQANFCSYYRMGVYTVEVTVL